MKKWITILLSCLLLALPALTLADIEDLPTERQQPLLVDEGDLLTAEEEETLLSELERISAEQKCDVVIVIPSSLGYKSATEYADDFYDENGYGYGTTKDGILLLVCLEQRDWATSTAGAAQDWFDDSKLYKIEDDFVPYLSNRAYYQAFLTFAARCESVLQNADRRKVLYLDDAGGFLSDADRAIVERDLESHSHAGVLCDIVVLTTSALQGLTPSEYVQSVYSDGTYRHGFLDDKIVMLVDRATSKCYCVIGGGAGTYFMADDLRTLEETVASNLGAGDAKKAFRTFANDAYSCIRAYYESQDAGYLTYETRSVQLLSGPRLFFALLLGFGVGAIVAGRLKAQLTSVRGQSAAADYLQRDTMQLTDSQDLFLYANVAKTLRQSESSRSGGSGGGGGGGSHFSSGGVSHGGHSGKF